MKVRVIGDAVALIMHNVQLANPMNKIAKAIKAITGKPAKQKTDDDAEDVFRLEFQGSLYWRNDTGPYLPGNNFEAAIVEAGRLQRKGAQFERALRIKELLLPLQYDGPRDYEDMYETGEFNDIRSVTLPSGSKVQRCRAIFKPLWSFEATIVFDPKHANQSSIEQALTDAGQLTGIGDHRPKYGKFRWEMIHVA